jgi:hypothetical protein
MKIRGSGLDQGQRTTSLAVGGTQTRLESARVGELPVEHGEVVEERNGKRVCEPRGAREHEWCHCWKASIEPAKYQNQWGPELEGHTVLTLRGRVSGAREKRHRHGEVCRGNNETASVHETWVRVGCQCVGGDDGEQVGGAVSEVRTCGNLGWGAATGWPTNSTASESRDRHEVSDHF